jgi:hypothetical protein
MSKNLDLILSFSRPNIGARYIDARQRLTSQLYYMPRRKETLARIPPVPALVWSASQVR